ncbi:hypothetical protein DPM19_14110 [Actinomadura craniellae]|uniref:LapA family protein n=1 Tax=Actinomadura craniellae TaxID=2231787 RepID=A0A365H6Y4_9ACTN|nr:hypothetical protein [Actinomadura craniellae]RAY14847.1 hypothetical protein DPM19_14110 [Actinomadura craniellae]
MLFLGLALTIAAIAIGVGVVLDNPDSAAISVYGEAVPGITSEWQIFLAGAVVATVFMIGATMTMFGLGRAVRRRHRLREMREEHEESMHTLELEKLRLQRELARVRKETSVYPSPSVSQRANSN